MRKGRKKNNDERIKIMERERRGKENKEEEGEEIREKNENVLRQHKQVRS